MSFVKTAIAAAALSLAAFASTGLAKAADLPVKAVKKAPDLPWFILVDDRVSFSWMPKGTDPGVFSVRPDGSINAATAKQVYSFTHFDIWQYGTNFFTISMFKSDHNDPANPCTNAGSITSPLAGFATSPQLSASTMNNGDQVTLTLSVPAGTPPGRLGSAVVYSGSTNGRYWPVTILSH